MQFYGEMMDVTLYKLLFIFIQVFTRKDKNKRIEVTYCNAYYWETSTFLSFCDT